MRRRLFPPIRSMIFVAFLGACGGTAAHRGVPVARPPFLRPHWDQVCFEGRGELPIRSIDEVVDAEWLRQRLAHQAHLWPDSSVLVADVGVNYSTQGAVERLGLVGSDLPEEVALEAVAAVGTAVRPIGGLLEPLHFRLGIRGGPEADIDLLNPLTCIPHAEHAPGAVGVYPGGVRMMGGQYYAGSSDVIMATLRIHVSEAGEITQVDFLKGSDSMESPAREFVAQHVRFQPALENGEAIASSIVVSLVFPAAARQ